MTSDMTATMFSGKRKGGGGPGLGGHRSTRSTLAALGGMAFAALFAACSTFGTQGATSTFSSTGPAAKLTTVAEFPAGYFLENVAVRADGSMLVTALNKNELWYVPAPSKDGPVQPSLLHTFDQPPFDIVETERDVFYVDTTNFQTTHDSYLQRVDLRDWQPGMPVSVQSVLKFPFVARALNGSCVLAPNVILVADSEVGLIWRVDLSANGSKATAHVWLKDRSMNPNPFAHTKWPQPGINGVEYARKTHYVYYTSTAPQLFMRMRVDPTTLNPVGDPQQVASGRMWDDFEIDENAGVAYITTHRQNTIERVPLDPHSGQAVQTIAGTPFDPQLVGPSDFAWGRGPADGGTLAYVTTDGGFAAPPPDGVVRTAKLLQAKLPGFKEATQAGRS